MEWLGGSLDREDAYRCIIEAIERIKTSQNIPTEDAYEMLDRILRKARATGLRPKPGDLNRLLEQSIGKVSE